MHSIVYWKWMCGKWSVDPLAKGRLLVSITAYNISYATLATLRLKTRPSLWQLYVGVTLITVVAHIKYVLSWHFPSAFTPTHNEKHWSAPRRTAHAQYRQLMGWAKSMHLLGAFMLYSSSRRVWHGLAAQEDSMPELTHALSCDFLSRHCTQSERIRSR